MARVLVLALAVLMAACLMPGSGLAEGAGSRLDQLKADLAGANQVLVDAQAAETAAQEALETAQATLAALDAQIEAAQDDADAKQVVANQKDAAAEAADADVTAAQAAFDQNAADIAAAQGELESAQAAEATTGETVTQAQAQVTTADQALAEAEEALDGAQAAIDAEVPDPGTNEGHEEWTAYGFFQYVRDNAPANSAAYWDAQCAMDILKGGTNTTGHTYATNQGPTPDGQNASSWSNISSSIVWNQRGDAVGLDNFKKSLQFLEEFNSIRGEENEAEGTTLSTNIGTNCRQMAISIVQCDASKDRSVGHTQAYSGLENLSWSSAIAVPSSRSRLTDPYVGWYDEEKVNYKEQNGGVTGHYTTIVDLNSGYYCEIAGFALCSYGGTYTECRELSTFGDFFDYNTNPTPEQQYSIADFTMLFDTYYAAQVEAGMFGTTDAEKAQHREALAAAQAAVETAQGNLDSANAALQSAQAAAQQAAATTAAAQSALATEQGKTAGLQEALAQAEAAASTAHEAATAAHTAYDQALAQIQALQTSNEYSQATADVQTKQAAVATAAADVTAAEQQVQTAQAALNAYTDLSANSEVSVEPIPAETYDGKAHEPAPTVNIGTDELQAGVDYTVSYEDNENAGTATVIITGMGDYHGKYTGGTFTIKPALVEIPQSQSWGYDGVEHGIYSNEYYEASGSNTAVDPGDYAAWLTLWDTENYRWDDGTAEGFAEGLEVHWYITRTPLENMASVAFEKSFVYTGSEIEPTVTVECWYQPLELGKDYTVDYYNNVDAGTATVVITGAGGYEGSITDSFTITPKAVTVTPNNATKVKGELDPKLTAEVTGLVGDDAVNYTLERAAGETVGTYEITASGTAEQGNYAVTFGTGTFTIVAARVEIPEAVEGLVYAGSEQEGVAASDLYTVTGGSATDAGAYTATAALADKVNYCWSDGTTGDKQITWSIAPKSIAGAAVSGIAGKTYTGKAQTQKPTVRLDGQALAAADFAVSYKNNVNAGTATVVIAGKGNYGGSVKRTFAIAKAANPMSVTFKAKTVKAKAAKTKAQVVKGAVAATKAQGAVTYAKVTKGSSKQLTINKKTGAITVKKGTKKGTYKIKVKVSAAGNANYLKASKTVTVTIKVK